MRYLIVKMSNWIENTIYENGTLKNKLNIKNQNKLQEIEYFGSAQRAAIILQQKPMITNLTDLRKIHKYMFSFLYDWAGKYRQGDFQKNGYAFFERNRFEFAEQDINELINSQNKKKVLSATDYAALLDKINFMHPFREGNGRSTKIFLQCYAAQHQQILDYPRRNEQLIQAQNEANIDQIANILVVERAPSRDAAYKELILKENNRIKKDKARKHALIKKQDLER